MPDAGAASSGRAATSRAAFVRNVGYSALSAASNGLLLVLVVVATRGLGGAYDLFAYALILAKIGETLMDFGLQQATIRGIARDRTIARTMFTNSVSLKALTGLAVGIALPLVPAIFNRDALWPCVLMLAGSILRSYVMTVRGVLQGLEQFGHDAAIEFGDRALMLVFGAAAVATGAGVVGLSAACLASRGVSLAWAVAVAHRHVGAPVPAFDYARWRELGQLAAPVGAFLMVVTVFSYIDGLILDALKPRAGELGLYANAYKLYEATTYASSVLAAVLTPRLAHAWAHDRTAHAALARRGVAGAVALAILVAALVWLLAPWTLGLLFGEPYRAATAALRILAAGLPFVFAIWILHAIALSRFDQRLLVIATVAGGVVNVVVNVALIPPYGRNGAALATAAGEGVAMAVLIWGLRDVLFGPRQART
ncbi:MAG TPA: oligosaccharide flippase family protein [Vicinamibacterales bacterium]|jgi:O-antigen/teichoic acid export membrane protein|nr:oligosaccharide flippase family protein [Vicinamibacterales bacterium]